MPSAPGGEPSATLGGWQLAINANSDHPEAAYSVIEYLLQPQQLVERLRVAGVQPARPSLYDLGAPSALPAVPPHLIQRIIAGATARPRSPVYAELSEVLQVWLHRALSGQTAPAEALSGAAREMKALLRRVGLAVEDGDG
jgi:ABC-type glycerol-3-phosphate transport system substrate-binding protein